MKIIRLKMAPIAATLALLVNVGCSESSSTWYDEVSENTQDKETYIQSMKAIGVDPREARADYEREIIIRKTEGRDRE